MNRYVLITAYSFLSVPVGAVTCAVINFFLYILLGTVDYRADRLTIGYALAATLVGAIIGLIVGIGNLNIAASAAIGLSAAVALWALYVYAMGNGGQYEFFSASARMTLIVFLPATTLAGIAAAASKNLILRLF